MTFPYCEPCPYQGHAERSNVSNSVDVDQCQIWDRMNCWNFIGSRTKNNGVVFPTMS